MKEMTIFNSSEVLYRAVKRDLQKEYNKHRIIVKDILMEGEDELIRIKYHIGDKTTPLVMALFDLNKNKFIYLEKVGTA